MLYFFFNVSSAFASSSSASSPPPYNNRCSLSSLAKVLQMSHINSQKKGIFPPKHPQLNMGCDRCAVEELYSLFWLLVSPATLTPLHSWINSHPAPHLKTIIIKYRKLLFVSSSLMASLPSEDEKACKTTFRFFSCRDEKIVHIFLNGFLFQSSRFPDLPMMWRLEKLHAR